MSKSEEDKEKDLELRRDALRGRQFSLADLIGQEGGGFLKGESPVPFIIRLKTEIKLFISNNLRDSSGALQAVLQDMVDGADNKIGNHDTDPLSALRAIIEEIMESDNLYYDFVRRVDLKSGQISGDRPYFQKPGQPAHPEDEYSHESVKEKLSELLSIIDTIQG
ncbi:hypothetical protein IQ215_00415 [Cyanobacterium stanieri LEGE 03274]|uniref:Uncharacterized protein n=1 Tax=Cyanobacterium stanieri LEGE 03274 TaxID=1828756 RepID=A0ABR9V2U9_9CHRO|nr:hypothetical protein [Cyanobacterium stanieri]MBE9221149.1 hypothetical protein [Cyanobacterium stanieri LEGE 03274]